MGDRDGHGGRHLLLAHRGDRRPHYPAVTTLIAYATGRWQDRARCRDRAAQRFGGVDLFDLSPEDFCDVVYMAWTSELTQAQIQHLDDSMEPKLTPEQQAEQDALEAEYQRERMEREWDDWGASPHQLASQQQAMELLGVPEG